MSRRIATALSVAFAAGTATLSAVGLGWPDATYPEADLRDALLANDLANLVVGLPALLACTVAAARGQRLGLVLWPGAVSYGVYNYIAYVYALPVGPSFLGSLIVLAVGLSAAAATWACLPTSEGRAQRFAGGLLTALGVILAIRVVGEVSSGAVGARADVAVLVADFLFAPAWIAGGVGLWSGRALTQGTALLFSLCLLFVGVIVVVLVRPALGGDALVLTDVLVLVGLAAPCFVALRQTIRR